MASKPAVTWQRRPDTHPIINIMHTAFGPIGTPIVAVVVLRRLSPTTHVPASALVLSGIIAGGIICVGYFTEGALATMASYCTAGIYISFQMVVAAALFARSRGWRAQGHFSLGRAGPAVTVMALLYGVATITNILWPRGAPGHWYTRFDILTTVIVVAGSGLIHMAVAAARAFRRLSAFEIARFA
jgi:hypothetical protein